MKFPFLFTFIFLAVNGNVVIPKQSGWYRGRACTFYEFEDVELNPTAEPPVMYSIVREDEWGDKVRILGQDDIIDRGNTTNYTGVWKHMYVITEIPPTTMYSSSSVLLAAAQQEGWSVVASGSFLYCPLVAADVSVEDGALQKKRILLEGNTVYCINAGTLLQYPSTNSITWQLRKLPTSTEVVGNALFDIRPSESGFTPLFIRNIAHVPPTYQDQSVKSFNQLSTISYQESSSNIIKSIYLQVSDPWWQQRSQWAHQLTLNSEQGIDLYYSVLPTLDFIRVRIETRFGSGYIAIGFGGSDTTSDDGEFVVAYLTRQRVVCVTYLYRRNNVFIASPDNDNLLGVTDLTVETTAAGRIVVVFTRKVTGVTIDSQGTSRPQTSIILNRFNKVFWGVRSGSPLSQCTTSVTDLIEHVSAPRVWGVGQVWWTSSSVIPAVTNQPITAPPPGLITPSPLLSRATNSPPSVPSDRIAGSVDFDSKLSLSWRALESSVEFTLKYKGNLRNENKWVGIGFGGQFTVADIITTWVTENGEVVVEDRKGLPQYLPPPLDPQQDVTLIAQDSSINNDLSTIVFVRQLDTGDDRVTFQSPNRTELVGVILQKQSGWFQGQRVDYYDLPTSTSDSVLGVIYLFLRANGSSIPGQLPLVDSVPGQSSYSSVRSVTQVTVPTSYVGPTFTWIHTIPEDWLSTTTTIINCPVVHANTRLQTTADSMRFILTELLYRGESEYCINFTQTELAVGTTLSTLSYPRVFNTITSPVEGTIWSTDNTTSSTAVDIGMYRQVLWNESQYTNIVVSSVTRYDQLPEAVRGITSVDGVQPIVNRFITNVHPPAALPDTPVPTEVSTHNNQMILNNATGQIVVLRWTIDDSAGVIHIEVESDVVRTDQHFGYVSIGFSGVEYTMMSHTDIVVGYLDNGVSCVQVLRSDSTQGAPSGTPTLTVSNTRVEFVNNRLKMSFTRGLQSNASIEGHIPVDTLKASRILYATSNNKVPDGICGTPTLSQSVDHHSNPHGDRVIYWRLLDGSSVRVGVPSTVPSSGLPFRLDVPITYSLQTGYFTGSEVEYYIIDNNLQGTDTSVQYQYVYDIWWPENRFAIVDVVPGLPGYSDLMKVKRVRVDNFPGNITSLQQLNSIATVFMEDTDEYWNCPVVSSEATFETSTTTPTQPTLRDLWYKDQLLKCAYFGKSSGVGVNSIYEVWRRSSVSGSLNTVRDSQNISVLTTVPTSLSYSSFNWLQITVVAESATTVFSHPDLISVSIATYTPSPPKIINTPITYVDAGSPTTLTPQVIPINQGYLANRIVYYADFGRSPTVLGSLLTSEMLVFRRQSDASYWSTELQNNIVSHVPGMTEYSGLWEIIIINVPDDQTTAGKMITNITSAGLIPSEWTRTTTNILIDCPITHKDTILGDYPDSGAAAGFQQLELYYESGTSYCMFVNQNLRSAADEPVVEQVYVSSTNSNPVFTSWPGNSPSHVVPQNYLGVAGVTHTSAAAVTEFTTTFTVSLFAYNWPIVAVKENTVASENRVHMTAVEQQGFYKGKSVGYWPITNSTSKLVPKTLQNIRIVRSDETTRVESEAVATSGVYIFRYGGVLLGQIDPVFESVPSSLRIRNSDWTGYSDLKHVNVVDIPVTDTISQTTSVSEIFAKVVSSGWRITTLNNIYYNYPICTRDSVPPPGGSGSSSGVVSQGWYDSNPIHFMNINEQGNNIIAKAYLVDSGKIVFPKLPEDPAYTAFHTVWRVPGASDTFDPDRDLGGALDAYPVSGDVHNFPILLAPSASRQENEVDLQKVYEPQTGWSNGNRVTYYKFYNTPSAIPTGEVNVRSMKRYVLRYGSSYTSEEAQSSSIMARNPGQDGYSDLSEIIVVNVDTGENVTFPIQSVTNLLLAMEQHSWSVVSSGIDMLIPAVHINSLLSEESDRILYPKAVSYKDGRTVSVLDFSRLWQDRSATLRTPLSVARVINLSSKESLIFNTVDSFPAARTCQEKIYIAQTTDHPIKVVNQSWESCTSFTTEATCPTQYGCVWSTSCDDPNVVYGCPILSVKSNSIESLPLLQLTRSSGWFDGRLLMYYVSPNAVSGNITTAITNIVYIFVRSDGSTITSMPPVFELMPTSMMYSDIHVEHFITIPDGYTSGAIRSSADAEFVVTSKSWNRTIGTVNRNWWLIHPDTKVEDRDSGVIGKHTAYSEGLLLRYLDFGVIGTLDHTEKFMLFENGNYITNNDIFTTAALFTAPSSPVYTSLVWEVSVLVEAGYKANTYTSVRQLSGTADYGSRSRISNNPVISINAPISMDAADDLPLSLDGSESFLWAYGDINTVTKQLDRCVDRQRGAVALQLVQTGVTLAPMNATTMSNVCTVFNADFEMCWEINIRPGTTPVLEMTASFIMKVSKWVSVAISNSPSMEYSDVWLGYADSRTSQIQDRYNAAGHSANPPFDLSFGGRSNLELVGALPNTFHDRFNITFKRLLDTSDTVSDITITDREFWISWAVGPWNDGPFVHTDTGMSKINFITGTVNHSASSDTLDTWWVTFTILTFILTIFSALYLTRCSSKNHILHVSAACWGSPCCYLTLAQVAIIVIYVSLLSVWIIMYAEQYRRANLKAPIVRGLGAGALLCFSLVLIPVTRSSIILRFFGMTKERALKWHRWNSTVLLLLVFSHGFGMVVTYSNKAIGWESGDANRQPGLAGFISFIGLVLQAMLVTRSCFGNGLKRRYNWKKLHAAVGIWTLAWAVIHHPPLIWGLLFSLIDAATDVMYQLYANYKATRRSAIYSAQEESFLNGDKVTSVEVKVLSSDHAFCYDSFSLSRLSPLQYVQVRFPAVSGAWKSISLSSRPIHIEDDQSGPFKGLPTTTFTIHIHSHEAVTQSWAYAAHQLVEARKLTSIQVLGPHGKPSLELRNYEHVILIGGGLGAASLVSVIEYYLDAKWGRQQPTGPSRTKLITLIWSAKDRRMFNLFCGEDRGAIRMALDVDHDGPTMNLNFVFRLFLHETHGNANPLRSTDKRNDISDLNAPSTSMPVDQLQERVDGKAQALGLGRIPLIHSGRPNLFQGRNVSDHVNVFDDLAAENEMGNRGLRGLSGRISNAAVVVCGPESMRTDVQRSIHNHNIVSGGGLTFHLHTEDWKTNAL